MRNEEDVIKLILNVAKTNNSIRAVLLNGSRANPNAIEDKFQDFDVTYIVTDLETFTKDHSWINIFGERLILQLPDEMIIGEKDKHSFTYLMLFEEGDRIDLTLFPLNKLQTEYKQDSLSVVLFDRDNLFEKLQPSSKIGYLIKRPTEKEFTDCCNEFWWVSTYVAEGVWRNEIIYAKEMLEIPVRSMFLKIIEWYIGVETGFTVSFGKAGRNIKHYVAPDLYNKILSTYPNGEINNIWNSLFTMAELFSELAEKIAQAFNFTYNKDEERNVINYLKRVHFMTSEK